MILTDEFKHRSQARELIGSGAVSEAPLIMRNNAWRFPILKVLKTVSQHHGLKGSIRYRVQNAEKPVSEKVFREDREPESEERHECDKTPERDKGPEHEKIPESGERIERCKMPSYSIWHHERWLEALITVREARRAISTD